MAINVNIPKPSYTTAEVPDSANARYVTDAQLTVIGNTSGTNTGDQDLSGYVQDSDFSSHSVLAKQSGAGSPVAVTIGTNELLGRLSGGGSNIEGLTASQVKTLLNYTSADLLTLLGWFYYNRVAESTAVTATTSETIIENITIPENTYLNGGIIRTYNNKIRKVGNSGTLAIRLYIGPTANNLTGATLVGTFSGIIASQKFAEMLRTFTCTTTGILGFSATQSAAADTGNSSAVILSASIDWTVEQNFMITVQLGNASDSVSLIGASLKNF